MRCALIGTRGIPARYGGFETAIEEVGRRLAGRGHEIYVFCRKNPHEDAREATYLGMRRIVLPAMRKRSLETLSHTALSVLHPALAKADAAIVFNAANAPLLPVVRARRIPVATHVDGSEWQRTKWGPTGRHYYRLAEELAVRWSDALIADAQGIADYYRDEFDAATDLIAYGAKILKTRGTDRLTEFGLERHRYHLVVARFEPENHVLEIVQAYVASRAAYPLVVVGSAPYSDQYTEAIEGASDDRVRLLGGVWDQDLLDALYANSLTYLHGHSVGGTNPSLLRAAGAAAPVIAFNVSFNREVVGADGKYFDGATDLMPLIEQAEADSDATVARGRSLQSEIGRYNWDDVAARYEHLLEELISNGPTPRSRRPTGRRMRG